MHLRVGILVNLATVNKTTAKSLVQKFLLDISIMYI